MNIKSIAFVAATLAGAFLNSSAFAACEKDDPCAPKKELNAWDKSLAVGFNLTKGNSDTTLLTILGNANRETTEDLIDFGLAYNFGDDKNAEDESGDSTTRNDVRANASYDYKYTERAYVGAGTKFLYDEIALVDYRVNLNPNLGYFLVKDPTFSFALEGGPGYTFEKVDGVDDNYLSPRIADRFEWIISCTSKLFQSAEVLLDVNDSENYIVNAELGVEAALNSRLSLVVALRNTYDNLPAVGVDKNDLTVISALKVAL